MTDLAVLMSVHFKVRFDFLQESVKSILSQTYSDFHYYIAIDGPVSREVDVYISNLDDNRIRLRRFKQNSGLAITLNSLLDNILDNPNYKFIARMDADDVSHPERFEIQRNFLIKNPDITLSGSWFEEIDEKGCHLSFRKLPTDPEDVRKRYFLRSPFPHASVMIRRQLFEVAGFYPVNTVLMEDNALWGKALKFDLKLANVPQYLLKFRLDNGFYKRRSGLLYGWNYILTRFNSTKQLSKPFYFYLMTILIGIIKMAPPNILKLITGIDRTLSAKVV